MKKDNILSTKYNQILWIIFICIVLVNIILASIAIRKAYFDGAPIFLNVLEYISRGKFFIFMYPEHPRFAINFLNQFPTHIAGLLFHVNNKFVLGFIDTFTHLFLPFLTLLWNYKITKNTGRKDIFAVSLLLYSFFIMLYQIWPQVEVSLSIMLFMLLYNYLCFTEKEYSKFDIFLIILILVVAYNSYEVIIFAAPLLYLTAIRTFGKTKNGIGRIIKFITAILILFAGIYNLWFMLHFSGEQEEITRFISECVSLLKYFIFSSNVLLSVLGVSLLFFCNTKKPFGKILLTITNIVIFGGLLYLLNPLDKFINPNAENTTRTLVVFVFPLFIFTLVLMDFLQKKFSDTFLTNVITVAITVGITHNIWQINNTYWWNNAVNSLKKDLITYNKALFIPEEHNFYFDLGNAKKRYISPFSYTAMSIIFSDTYEIKHILVQPEDDTINPGAGRENLFYIKEWKCLKLPAAILNEKNKFWDLRNVISALDEDDKKKNIQHPKLKILLQRNLKE